MKTAAPPPPPAANLEPTATAPAPAELLQGQPQRLPFLPPLLVAIHKDGKYDRTVAFRDPRIDFCRSFNNPADAWPGDAAYPVTEGEVPAADAVEAVAELECRRRGLRAQR